MKEFILHEYQSAITINALIVSLS